MIAMICQVDVFIAADFASLSLSFFTLYLAVTCLILSRLHCHAHFTPFSSLAAGQVNSSEIVDFRPKRHNEAVVQPKDYLTKSHPVQANLKLLN